MRNSSWLYMLDYDSLYTIPFGFRNSFFPKTKSSATVAIRISRFWHFSIPGHILVSRCHDIPPWVDWPSKASGSLLFRSSSLR